MKKTAFISLVSVFMTAFSFMAHAQLYKGKPDASSISFFSKTPLEDIDATNTKITIMLKTSTNDIQFGVPMVGFKFPKPLMEEHFNENYVESSKYPICTFRGKISEGVDYKKEGVQKVTVKGTMKLHDVSKEIAVPGTLEVKGNEILINANFKIKLADYKIEIPTVVAQKIAEEVEVTVKSTMAPFEKK